MRNQLPEPTTRILSQLNWISNLNNLTLIHSNNPVTTHNSLNPMSNIDHSFTLKILIQILNDFSLLFQIDVARSLIHNNNLFLTKNRPEDSNQLLFSCAEILTSTFDSKVESVLIKFLLAKSELQKLLNNLPLFFLYDFYLRSDQQGLINVLPFLRFGLFTNESWIDVFKQSSFEQRNLLTDDQKLRS